MEDNLFDKEISVLNGVSKRRATLLQSELSLVTLDDLLHLYPYRYIDRTRFYKINQIKDDNLAYIQIKARVRTISEHGVGRAKRLNVIVADDSGVASMVWFGAVDYIKRRLEIDREYIFFGKPSFYNGVLNISHPEFDIPYFENNLNKPKVYGVYSTTEKLNKAGCNTKFIAGLVLGMWKLVYKNIQEFIPTEILKKYQLMSLAKALYNIHFPQSEPLLREAQRRLKFEEFFMVQLSLLNQKNIRIAKNKGLVFPILGDKFNTFYEECLPFELTNAQKKVIKEIRRDTLSGIQMNRLLQGDVGSGKTIVALI
ncbi:MAG: ATP-dependent DNA helicase RecG, partial [Bacteroidetes bacterium]|nr:ATP-dependent DNA helicase RecG [Bacteroidota bacterium]